MSAMKESRKSHKVQLLEVDGVAIGILGGVVLIP
jgi:hypothetical protein